MLTPDYASPEHAQGLPVTEASDIYSLGILLYELLTDHHPYRFLLVQPVETNEVAPNNVPEKPSRIIFAAGAARPKAGGNGKFSAETIGANRATTLNALHEELKEDLDAIVLKAINKNPRLRYQTADELIGELERHLTGKSPFPDRSNSSAPLSNRKKEAAHLLIENAADRKNKPAIAERETMSRRKGVRQGVFLMMLGVVGTPLVALLSVGLKWKPTWMLIFAVLTILGGFMRLGYAFIFEKPLPQNDPDDVVQSSAPEAKEKESRLLNERFFSPGTWMEDFNYPADDDAVKSSRKADQNKTP
jgi:serine/threonine protein kinase